MPAFLGDRYDKDENLLTLSNPLSTNWGFLKPESSRDYRQELDMHTGELTTSWSQSGLGIRSKIAIDPESRSVAEQWYFEMGSTSSLELPIPTSDPMPALTVVGLKRISNQFVTRPNVPNCTFEEVWTYDDRPPKSFTAIETASRETWNKRWQTDIQIDGPAEDQTVVHSFLFYLRSTVGGATASMSPFGLSNSQYHGHVFWDADTWIFPSLSLLDPRAAQSIPTYRLAHVPQAVQYANGKGIRYPWQSAVTGKHLPPALFDDEIHVTGDVVFMLSQAASLGLAPQEKVQAVVNSADDYFASRARPKNNESELPGIRGPDEYVKNTTDLYTECLAQWLADHAQPKDSRTYYLPKDGQGLLSHEGDSITEYQQASAILAIFPLENPIALKQAEFMMQRFPPKTSRFSPAMSKSLEALIWARLGDTNKAYDAWQQSWRNYTEGPFLNFCERPARKDSYFITGAAGSLQTVLYGFLGFGIEWQQNKQAAWASRLKEGHWLNVQPHLPAQWKSVTLRNLTVLGKRYTLFISRNRTTVMQGEP